MPIETSFADLEVHVFINCGTKAMVVKTPASKPKASCEFNQSI